MDSLAKAARRYVGETRAEWHRRSEQSMINALPCAMGSGRSLDLGCGLAPRNPFGAVQAHGIDVRPSTDSRVVRADLVVDVIPFDDKYFDYVTAYDFVEHIPRHIIWSEESRFPFVMLMNEIHRVLANGGIFFAKTPAFPAKEAFQDPTHVNVITKHTFPRYFCEPHNWAAMYGFVGSFHLIKQTSIGSHLLTVMRRTT